MLPKIVRFGNGKICKEKDLYSNIIGFNKNMRINYLMKIYKKHFNKQKLKCVYL